MVFAAEAVLLRIWDWWTQTKICDLVMLFQGSHPAEVLHSSARCRYLLTCIALYPVADKYKKCKHSLKQTSFPFYSRDAVISGPTVMFSVVCFSPFAVLWNDWGCSPYAWCQNQCCLYTLILLWIHFLNRALWGTYLSGGLLCAFWMILLMPNMLRTAKVTLSSIYPVVQL